MSSGPPASGVKGMNHVWVAANELDNIVFFPGVEELFGLCRFNAVATTIM